MSLDQHSGEAGSVLREIGDLIEEAGDCFKEGKLIQQFSDAFAFVSWQRAAECMGATEFFKSTTKWPEPEPALIESIGQAFATRTLAWWESISPAQVSELERSCLPSEGSGLLWAQRRRPFRLQAGEGLYQIARRTQYVVPNPAKAPFVNFADGKTSRKCVENFPERRFLVIEFDRSKIDPGENLSLARLLDLQAALHAHLATQYAPIMMLVPRFGRGYCQRT